VEKNIEQKKKDSVLVVSLFDLFRPCVSLIEPYLAFFFGARFRQGNLTFVHVTLIVIAFVIAFVIVIRYL
jgi:hypothetical protein